MKPKVYVQLPKAGLGNMLLTWSRGYVFAQLNGLEMCTSSWTKIHLGAWLRMERKKRLYFRYFKGEGIWKRLRFAAARIIYKKQYEPEVVPCIVSEKTVYVFNKIFTDYDFFKEVRPYKNSVREGLFSILTPDLLNQFNSAEKPVIGVHIRRGDFKIGSTLTPVSFFIEVITSARAEAKEELPATIFTDAEEGELEEMLRMPGVKIAQKRPDILDILLLASSKIAVLSIGSTFSYWAGFLSEGAVITHLEEWHVPFN